MKKNDVRYEHYSFGFIYSIFIALLFLVHRRKYKGILPIVSTIETPKLEYEILSGAFYWNDEGIEETYWRQADIFKSLLLYRGFILEYGKQKPLNTNLKIYKWIFNSIKKNNPNWVGFQKSRCSFNPEIADRMRRIRKISEWKIDKAFQEADKYDERISK